MGVEFGDAGGIWGRMRSMYKIIFLIQFILCFIYSFNSFANSCQNSKNFVVIQSYSVGYEWLDELDMGITKAFHESNAAGSGWTVYKFYLHGKKLLKPEQIAVSVNQVKTELNKMCVGAVFLADDLAFKYFYKYFLSMSIPIGFAGVQGDLKEYGYNEGQKNVTGALEYYNFVAVIKLFKMINKNIKNILFICDNNISGIAHTKNFLNQTQNNPELIASGIISIKDYSSNNYESLLSILLAVDASDTAVIVASYFSYFDSKNNLINYRSIDRWIFNNTKFLDAGLSMYQVRNGRLLSVAFSSEEMGRFVTANLFKGIINGEDVSKFGIRSYNPLKLLINKERAQMLGIQIPYDILVYEQADQLIN